MTQDSDDRDAAMLAGGHCVPIKLPDAMRMVWHKLYSSTQRKQDPAKAQKDLLQAATLAAILVEQDGASLRESFRQAPKDLRDAALARLPGIEALLTEHPQALGAFHEMKGKTRR